MEEKMKKPGVKVGNILMIILTLVCAAAVSLGMIGTLAIVGTGASMEEALNKTSYFDLARTRTQFMYDAMNRIQAEMSEGAFWVDGIYDGEQTVDITKLSGGIRVSDKNPATTYRMKDLVTMYEASVDSKLYDLINQAEEENGSYPEIIQYLEENYNTTEYYVDNLGNLYAGEDYEGRLDEYLDAMPFVKGQENNALETYGVTLYMLDGDKAEFCYSLPEGFEDLENISWSEFSARYMLDLSPLDEREKTEFNYSEYGYEFQYLYKYGKECETLLPESGEKLAVYALKHPAEVSILDCYKELAAAIEQVGTAVVNEEYDTITVVDATEEPMSLYWVRDVESGKIWTNNPIWEKMDVDQVEKEIQGRSSELAYPSYWIQEGSMQSLNEYELRDIFVSSYGVASDEIIHMLMNDYGLKSVELAVAMNPQMQNGSVLLDVDPQGYADKQIYNLHMPYAWTYLLSLLIGSVGAAVFFILSIVLIGRRDKTKVRYAGPFAEKIPVEGLVLLDIGCWIGYALFVYLLCLDGIFAGYYGDSRQEIIMSFVALMIFAALVVWQVLTLVAKGKSKNMGTNSWFGRAGSELTRGARSKFSEKCPIELLLLLFLVIWIVLSAVTGGLGWVFNDGLASVILVLVVLAVIAILAYWQIATLIHKGRTHNMKTNSLIGRFGGSIVRAVKDAYRNRKVTGKLVIWSILFCAVNLIFVGLAVATYVPGFFIFLLIVFWIVVIGLLMKKCMQKQRLKEGIHEIAGGNMEYQIKMEKLTGDELDMAWDMNNIKEGMETAVERMMKSERMKTDLITNVSHDLKTPLTSIINYVDILKKEDIQDEKIRGYIDILEQKSLRLKNLTEDLMEAAKISSGNITLDMQNINLKELLYQTNGEFEEKFARRNLTLVCTLPESDVYIKADGRRMWRVIENLYNNAAKYAQPYSRVYVDGTLKGGKVTLVIKNVSEAPLNISADELMERFVRGDVARNTEGSGLGLEIARNLTVMQKGTFDILLDGDLFKVVLTFDAV